MDVNGFDGIIKQLEEQKAAIDRALEALREVGGGGLSVDSAPLAATSSEKRSAAQKARWAAKRAGQAPSAAPVKRKGGMTPEGRQKLADAMKRRWAAKRAASQAKRGPGRPKKTAS